MLRDIGKIRCLAEGDDEIGNFGEGGDVAAGEAGGYNGRPEEYVGQRGKLTNA